jgi:ribulose-5-phosphate 4-epimerase/fuculose-1-phosphate aldolase
MLITPSSMDYFDIKPEDIVRMDINTLAYGDQRVPSNESLMHATMYRRYADCGAVIHTHSNGMSVFAACEAGFAAGHAEVKQLVGDTKVTKYARAGSAELAEAVADTMSDTHAAVIPHHGAVFTGPSLEIAFRIAEAMELRARNILDFDGRASEEDEE